MLKFRSMFEASDDEQDIDEQADDADRDSKRAWFIGNITDDAINTRNSTEDRDDNTEDAPSTFKWEHEATDDFENAKDTSNNKGSDNCSNSDAHC